MTDTVATAARNHNQRNLLIGNDPNTAFLIAVAFAVLYISTLCRTTYVIDSGEMASAIATDGIIHPPGYPLFSLLGKLFLFLIPIGEPAFRIGCLVALASASAVALLYRFCRALGASQFAALISAATFGTSYLFWSQATRVEVYGPQALFYGLALWGATLYGQGGNVKYLYFAALGFSLGLAHHLTIVFLLPALLLLAGMRFWTDARPLPRIGSVILTIIAAGPPLYLLLLLRAKAEPVINWGRPVTLPALLNHVSARNYQGLLRVPTPQQLQERLTAFALLLGENLLWVGLALSVAGGIVLWKRNRRLAGGLLFGALTIAVYNPFYGISDISVYYLPVLWIATALLSLALHQGLIALQNTRVANLIASLLVVCLPLIQVGRNFASCDLSHVTFVRELAQQKLEHCDRNGVLIVETDDDFFPIQYAQMALHIRPDVLVIERTLFDGAYLNYEKDPSAYFLYRLRRLGIDVSTEIPTDRAERIRLGSDGALIALLEKLSATRSIHTTFLDDRTPEERQYDAASGQRTMRPLIAWFATRFDPVPQGLVLRLQAKDSTTTLAELIARNKALWDNTVLPETTALRYDQETDAVYFTHYYATMLVQYGHLYELNRDPQNAAQVYALARQVAPESAPVKATWEAFRQKYPVIETANNTQGEKRL
jgi:hypothetical protein